MNDPEDIFTVGPGMTLLEAYTKAIARVAELEQEVKDHQSIEQGHLHLIAELKSKLKLK